MTGVRLLLLLVASQVESISYISDSGGEIQQKKGLS
jgi:hypothetical protein